MAAQLVRGRVDRQECVGSRRTQGNDDLRIDHGDLPHQEWRTGVTFIAQTRGKLIVGTARRGIS